MSDLPFRVQLDTTGLDQAASRDLTLFLDAAVFDEPLDLDLESIARTGPEVVAWHIARRLRGGRWTLSKGFGNVDRKQLVLTLVQRALADAAHDAVQWTLLLDVLADTKEWGELANEGQLPRADEVVAPLADWIATRTNPAELGQLDAFRSAVLRSLLARNARVLDQAVTDRLLANTGTARELIDNPAAGSTLRTPTFIGFYRRWRDANGSRLRGDRRTHFASNDPKLKDEYELMMGLAREGIPPELRAELVADIERFYAKEPIALLLLADPTLPPEMLGRLYDIARLNVAVAMVEHPACTPELREKLLTEHPSARDVTSRLLRTVGRTTAQLTEQELERAYEWWGGTVEFALTAIAYPTATPRMWRNSLRRFDGHDRLRVMKALAEVPAARTDEVIRTELLKSRSRHIITGLLHEADPQTFDRLFRHLWNSSRSEAIDWLSTNTLPEGARLPRSILEEMLTHEKQSVRLIAISLVGAARADRKTTRGR